MPNSLMIFLGIKNMDARELITAEMMAKKDPLDLSGSELSKKFKIGLYRHYKGTLYSAIGIARHSETLEELVIYQDVDNPVLVWARPLEMFCSTIELEGQGIVPRFSFVEKDRL